MWDGSRFHELRWFWNPETEWLLPTEALRIDKTRMSTEQNVNIKCTNCATQFYHCSNIQEETQEI